MKTSLTPTVMCGDARRIPLDDGSVHCVVTSPPYFGLRAYGGDPGMIGLEPTFDDHLGNLVDGVPRGLAGAEGRWHAFSELRGCLCEQPGRLVRRRCEGQTADRSVQTGRYAHCTVFPTRDRWAASSPRT